MPVPGDNVPLAFAVIDPPIVPEPPSRPPAFTETAELPSAPLTRNEPALMAVAPE